MEVTSINIDEYSELVKLIHEKNRPGDTVILTLEQWRKFEDLVRFLELEDINEAI